MDTDGEDHVADETRYFCMARPVTPAPVAKKEATFWDIPEAYLKKAVKPGMEILNG